MELRVSEDLPGIKTVRELVSLRDRRAMSLADQKAGLCVWHPYFGPFSTEGKISLIKYTLPFIHPGMFGIYIPHHISQSSSISEKEEHHCRASCIATSSQLDIKCVHIVSLQKIP